MNEAIRSENRARCVFFSCHRRVKNAREQQARSRSNGFHLPMLPPMVGMMATVGNATVLVPGLESEQNPAFPREYLAALARHRFAWMREELPTALTALLQEIGHYTCPTGLMAGADPCAILTMEIFVEEHEVAPMRVLLKFLDPSVHSPAPLVVPEEYVGQAAGEFCCDLPERHGIP